MNQVDVLDELYRHWRNQDIDGLAALFTDDCVYEDMAMRVIHTGKPALIGFVTGVYGSMPDFNVTFRSRFATPDYGAGEWTISATWQGDYEGVDVSGRQIRFHGLSFYEFKLGKIARNVDCWDPTVVMEQLGVLPEGLAALRRS
jgi:steroid delta-isomerase-like uncharacterized protein